MERRMTIAHIALIGFGEVGQILANDLGGTVESLTVWDITFPDQDSPPSCALKNFDVTPCDSARQNAALADLVISAVTAAQTVTAAQDAAPSLEAGAYYLDLNSASPDNKKQAAHIINEAGGRFVEATVMAPFTPKRLASPILLGGPFAETFLDTSSALGFAGAEVFSSEYGKASAAKMCRSVLIKGIEALLTESLLTARHTGVDEAVLDSLNDLFPGPDWRALARYMIRRSVMHGARRAEEMSEAARTVREAGIDSWMSESIAKRQNWAAHHYDTADQGELGAMLDAILNKIHLPGEPVS